MSSIAWPQTYQQHSRHSCLPEGQGLPPCPALTLRSGVSWVWWHAVWQLLSVQYDTGSPTERAC
jgi:hypothetical protein